MKVPPCKSWSVWVGPEIEGDVQLGAVTLFIRHAMPGTLERYITASPWKVTRVWFCAEFTDWAMVRQAYQRFQGAVCLEVNAQTIERVPKDVRTHTRIYYKLDAGLKEGDFVCAGPAYRDEAFRIGTGHKVSCEQYLADRRLA